MAFWDGVGGGLVGGLLSIVGGERANDARAEQAQAANAFSAQQFANRYQTTVKDMAAAGLNPMLAYSQGGGTPPSGQQAQVQDTLTPAVESFNKTRLSGVQERITNAQVANIEADTENKKAQADLIAGQAAQAWATASQANANTTLINNTVDKTKQEIVNLKTVNEQAIALTDNLRVQRDNLIKEGYNLVEVGNNLRMTWNKLKAEVDLVNDQAFLARVNALLSQNRSDKIILENVITQKDIDAMNKTGDVGRVARELKPLSDIGSDWLNPGKWFTNKFKKAK